MRDQWFVRGRTPMTKEEVRAVSIAKLDLTPGAVLYDVGAGTGSISIEASRQLAGGTVYAIERDPEALFLLEQNRARFGAEAVRLVPEAAPEAFAGLPAPTHAFVGGSGGRLEEILYGLREKNPRVRIVVNAAALETLGRLLAWLEKNGVEADLCALQASRGRVLGGYHLMEGMNPVYVAAFGGEERRPGL